MAFDFTNLKNYDNDLKEMFAPYSKEISYFIAQNSFTEKSVRKFLNMSELDASLCEMLSEVKVTGYHYTRGFTESFDGGILIRTPYQRREIAMDNILDYIKKSDIYQNKVDYYKEYLNNKLKTCTHRDYGIATDFSFNLLKRDIPHDSSIHKYLKYYGGEVIWMDCCNGTDEANSLLEILSEIGSPIEVKFYFDPATNHLSYYNIIDIYTSIFLYYISIIHKGYQFDNKPIQRDYHFNLDKSQNNTQVIDSSNVFITILDMNDC